MYRFDDMKHTDLNFEVYGAREEIDSMELKLNDMVEYAAENKSFAIHNGNMAELTLKEKMIFKIKSLMI